MKRSVVMFGERERRWIVSIVTRTSDKEALRVWTTELTRRGCEFVITDPDDVLGLIARSEVDAFLIDDVSPAITPQMGELALVLTRTKPEPKMVFLVSEQSDIHHLHDLVDDRALIHSHNAPNMDSVYDYLSGQTSGDVAQLFSTG